MSAIKKINEQKFLKMVGETDSLTPECRKLIKEYNLEYQHLSRYEFEQAVAHVWKHAQARKKSVSGVERRQEWENGWQENLQLYKGTNPKSLKPGYFRPEKYIRLDHTYVKPITDDFVFKFLKILQSHVFLKQIRGYQNIFELGSGSGHNLSSLSDYLPNNNFIGLDWSTNAVDIANKIGFLKKRSIKGKMFNFFSPEEYNIEVPEDSIFITTGAFEQIGTDHKKILNFIINKKPKKIVHFEPIHEFYDKNNLSDLISLDYHLKRGYLENYYQSLLELQDAGIIEIEKAQRVNCGGLFHDGWSILVWRPL